MARKHTCADCGADFPNLAQLTAHKAECPGGALKHMQDDNPTDSDNAAFRDAPKAVKAPVAKEAAAPPPVTVPAPKPTEPAKPAAPKPATPVMPVIPWGVPGVDNTLKVLIGTTPIRFEGQAYARQDGLHPFEVRTPRRQRSGRK